MLESFTKLIEVLSQRTQTEVIIVCCIAVVFGAIYFLYNEYKKAGDKVTQLYGDIKKLNEEKLEMAQEMLRMANEYNEQMVQLQRETGSTITSLMAMFNIMKDR